MKIIIAGSRNFTDLEILKGNMDQILSNSWDNEIEIVSGGARGADKMGETYAEERNLEVAIFPADWKRLGKRAGYLRNEQMAEYATHLVAFWDGESKGTKHMIDLATKNGLKVRVVKV